MDLIPVFNVVDGNHFNIDSPELPNKTLLLVGHDCSKVELSSLEEYAFFIGRYCSGSYPIHIIRENNKSLVFREGSVFRTNYGRWILLDPAATFIRGNQVVRLNFPNTSMRNLYFY